MHPATLLLAAASPLLAHAFYNTTPLIAWSLSSAFLDTLPIASTSRSVLADILNSESACKHNVIILIDQLDLHASDLRNLTPTSGLFKSLERSKSSRQYPYIKRESSEDTLYLAERLSTQCNAQLRSISLEQDELKLTSSSNYVVYISIPALDSTGDTRLAAMAESDGLLFNHLDNIASDIPDHLFVFTGSYSHSIKRQHEDSPVFTSVISQNSTEGGIFKRYQLFTPGLILSLAIAFFILVPILMFGINALSSIQSPVRLDAPKGFNAQDKKNQ